MQVSCFQNETPFFGKYFKTGLILDNSPPPGILGGVEVSGRDSEFMGGIIESFGDVWTFSESSKRDLSYLRVI